ncbi:MAG: hypothetical protein QF440_00020 [Candidatus Thalassarchaeaceae archaeon]|nr:hypothetical protein [Candidatus Thalassarchaeaceae archaeon]
MRQPSGAPKRDDEKAVSEIMGVTMLLAMVITTMAGVVVVMQPFMQDLNDNREWTSASVAANQFNDRLLIAAEAPEGSGLVVSSVHLAEIIQPVRLSEIWKISADLSGDDRVTADISSGRVSINSVNGTAAEVRITTTLGQENGSLQNGQGQLSITLDLTGWILVDVFNSEGDIIYRWIQVPLDGIRLSTPLTGGDFTIDLINGARVQQLPNKPVDIFGYPRLDHDLTLNGEYRVSLVLLDTDMVGTGFADDASLELISEGQITFFSDEARNVRIETDFTSEDGRATKYRQEWTDDYDLHRSTGELENYVGFGPYGRISGVEGMTMHPTYATISLDVLLQQVVVK